MAKRRRGLNFRFRKSFPLLGNMLKGTVSKRGLSLNFRFWIFSKSWGTGRRRTSTVDLPGTSGLSWRSQGKASEEEVLAGRARVALFLGSLLLFVELLVILARLNIDIGRDCALTGHPNWKLAIISGVMVFFLVWLRSLAEWRRLRWLLVCVVCAVLLWLVADAWILSDLACA